MDKNKRAVIALPSITYAMTAHKLLNNYGIYSQILKLNPEETKKGCGNGIALDRRDLVAAESILYRESIPISEIR